MSILGNGYEPERRHVTALFCDIVGYTRLSQSLDPELLDRLLARYRRICGACVLEYGGSIERHVGDGALACFGYPTVVENRSQRAVNSALAILQKVQSEDWSALTDQPVQVRIGIDQGVAVVGGLSIVGTPGNIASRVQALAAPNTVVVSARTHEDLDGQFLMESIGTHSIKGLNEPMELFHVVRSFGTAQLVDRVTRHALLPMVGRERELGELLAAWEASVKGTGKVVVVQGDAGIGKSRLIEEFRLLLESQDQGTLLHLNGSPYHAGSRLYPVAELLRRVLEGAAGPLEAESLGANLDAFLKDRVGNPDEANYLLRKLLSLPPRPDLHVEPLSPEAQRARTQAVFQELVFSEARKQPVLLVFSELHWADPSTLEVLRGLAASVHEHRCLLVASYRPTFEPVGIFPAHTEFLSLREMDTKQVEKMARQLVRGKKLPAAILKQVTSLSEGNPLLVEEVVRAVLDSEQVIEKGDRIDVAHLASDLTIPDSLQDLLLLRLDRLGPAKTLAQLCSAMGGHFSSTAVAAIWDADPLEVEKQFQVLAEHDILQKVSPDRDSWSFRHALLQSAAYESLLKGTRQEYHRRIAQYLSTAQQEMSVQLPEVAALHFTEAGMHALAIEGWTRGAAAAVQESANLEALALADRGLECIAILRAPDALREAQLTLLIIRGTALIASRGFGAPEVLQTFEQAEAISRQVGGSARGAPALAGLWAYHHIVGRLADSQRQAEQIVRIGEESGDSAATVDGHWRLGGSHFYQGHFEEARWHLETALRMYEPETHRICRYLFGQDPAVSALMYLTHLNALCCRTEEAQFCSEKCLELARSTGHAFSIVTAMSSRAMLKLCLGDVQGALESGQEALDYCREQQAPFWMATQLMVVGWAKVQLGRKEEGFRQVERGLEMYAATGAELNKAFFCALMADCCAATGRPDRVPGLIDEGLRSAKQNGEQPFVSALLLLRGGLLLQQGAERLGEAEAALREGIGLAESIGLTLREQQGRQALGALLQMQGKPEEARAVMAPVVAWNERHAGSHMHDTTREYLGSLRVS